MILFDVILFNYYYVYSNNESVYEEKVFKEVKVKNLEHIKDSLQELHKDKYDYLYIKYLNE